ncbi:aspartate/glutamate racemase family protein [Caenimonas sedimenti]|uniref:Aspartate/glutamate racemase family protein n=2 Tax=Caenimonas sedimenti TaxID=2596921 RepID=A0A562ZW14_9BURK|nr:aspartate/glutamate racemase family protein [Caenimonas sedimenti]
MLDTRFPRPPGDVGHPQAFGVPVRQLVVQGAFPREVVRSAESLLASGLQQRFIDAARQLEQEGARAITTSCGFLVLMQAQLQAAVSVPLVSSSLLQLPALLQAEPQVGVLTISAEHLGQEFLLAAGVPPARLADVIVQGMKADGEFTGAILGNRARMDLAQAQAEVVAAAGMLQARAPGLRTVVLECTNLPPYAGAVSDATGWHPRSLLDARELVDWLAHG